MPRPTPRLRRPAAAPLRRFSEGSGELHGVDIFAAGTHRQKTYTPAHLDEMVANFNRFSTGKKPGFRVPAVLGHEESQDFLERSDLPAAAWCSRVWVDPGISGLSDEKLRTLKGLSCAASSGDKGASAALHDFLEEHDLPKPQWKLKADFEDVPPKVMQLLKGKRYRTVSSEVYDDPPEGIPGKGKMLRRVAFLGGDLPQIKQLEDIPLPEQHSESRTFAKYTPCHITLARVSERPLAGAYVCFSEVSPMSREELIQKLQELGVDTSVLGEQVPDEALAEMIRVLTDDQEPEEPEAPEEPQELDDEPEAPVSPEKPEEMDDDPEQVSDQYDDEPPDIEDPVEKKKAIAKYRSQKAFAEKALAKYCDEPGKKEPAPMGQFSEKAALRLIDKVLDRRLGKKMQRFEKFTEQQLASQKKATIEAFCEEMLKAGKLTPAQLDREGNPANVYDRLMRADASRIVHKFTEKGKEVRQTELDLQMQEIRNTPARRFSEKLPAGKGRGGKTDPKADRKEWAESTFERFSDSIKAAGFSRETFVAEAERRDGDKFEQMKKDWESAAV